MNTDTLKLDQDNFHDEIIEHEGTAVVDFWAEWCAPCRAIAPIIKELASKYEGQVKVVKMNVDESPLTPGKYNVKAIPTVLAFRDGEVVEQLQGARPRPVHEDTA